MTVREAVRRAAGDPTGQCYAMAEAYWYLEGRRLGWRPTRGEGSTRATGHVSHWWLARDGRILDLARRQFQGERFPYENGAGRGFLTPLPSKRADEIIKAACILLGRRPKTVVVRVSVNGHKIRQNQQDGGRRRVFRRERGARVTYCNQVRIPAGAKLVYRPERPLRCGARAWIQWEEAR